MNYRVLTISLFLLLGAIANVVVAWSCCLLQVQTQPTSDGVSSFIAMMEVEADPQRTQRVIDAGARVLDRDERSRLIAVGWQPSDDPW